MASHGYEALPQSSYYHNHESKGANQRSYPSKNPIGSPQYGQPVGSSWARDEKKEEYEEAPPPPPPAHKPNPKDEISMQAFTELCQQLRTLGYEQEIGIDTAPLVYRLLQDLLLTTENYEQLHDHAQKSDQTIKRLEKQVRPLQDEINRLTKHNNEVSV